MNLSERPTEGLRHKDEALVHLLEDQDLVQLVIQAHDLVLDVLVLTHLTQLKSEVPQLVIATSLHIFLHISVLGIEMKMMNLEQNFYFLTFLMARAVANSLMSMLSLESMFM